MTKLILQIGLPSNHQSSIIQKSQVQLSKAFYHHGKVENTKITRFFMHNTFISNARLKLSKNQAKAKQHLEAELLTKISK